MGKWDNTGLGDYIHYSKINYLRHGIYRSFGRSGNKMSAEASLIEAHRELKSIIDKTRTKGKTEDIEKYYNMLLSSPSGWQEVSSILKRNVTNEEIQIYEQALIKSIEQKIPGAILDRDLITVSKNNENLDNIVSKYKGTSKKNQQGIKVSTLIKLAKECESKINYFTDILKKGTIPKKSVGQIKKNVLFITIVKNYFERVIEKNSEEKLGHVVKFRDQLGQNNLLGNFLIAYNKLISQWNEPTKTEIGTAAEVFVSMGAVVAQNKVNEGTSQIVKSIMKGVAGDKKSAITYDNISGKFLDQETMKKYDKNWTFDEGIITTAKASQDTVDVMVSFEDDQNIFGTDTFMASVKNYSDALNGGGFFKDYQGISLIKGAPLLSVFNLVNTNFGNHYLNLVAAAGTGSDRADLNNSYFPSSGEFFGYYNNTLKYALAVRALSGARSQNSSKLSQYFILNNRINNHIYVWTTEELLEPFSLFDDNSNNIKITPELPSQGSIPNIWSDTPQQRITKILLKIHQIKLTAYLTTDFLKNRLKY